jgi:hypothetical protein
MLGSAGLCAAHHMMTDEVHSFAFLFTSLLQVDVQFTLSVLDPVTGESLEHCQLCCNPRYKTRWDTLYTNELGCLCQGICSGDASSAKHVAGTNTFFLINYQDIPSHKRKEICHTMVVCEVCSKKDDPDRTQITIGGNCICYPGDVGTNTTLLEFAKPSFLTVSSLGWGPSLGLSSIDLKTFYLDKLRGASPRRHLCTFRILIPYYFVLYIMPLCHSAIPPFHHFAILPFCHSAILPFYIPSFPSRHSSIPPFCHSAIPPFRHSAIPPFHHSAILPFRSNTQ